MHIENYNTFLVLARTLNFSKTAEKLNLVQSTVSARIVELEKYLDKKLFVRSKRCVELTNSGQLLLPYAIKLVETEAEGKKLIKGVKEFEDCLRITVPGSVYRQKISEVVEKFYSLYPQYRLDIRFHKTSSQLDMFMDNETDIGFISRKPITSKVEVSSYIKYSWILVARKDYNIPDVIKASELLSLELSYNHLNPEYNEWLLDVLPNGLKSRISLNNTSQLIEYVNKGYLCAFLPSYSIEKELSEGSFKQISIEGVTDNEFDIYMAVNKKRIKSDVVNKFLALVKENGSS